MWQGFVKTAAATPKIKVADCSYNREAICQLITTMSKAGSKIMVFPELSITGYTCGDLFWQTLLLEEAKKELIKIIQYTENIDGLIFVGLPFEKEQKLYNVAAVINRGKLIGFVPKTHLPNYNEFYEARHFTKAPEENASVLFEGKEVAFGTKLLFICEEMPNLVISAEICEDVWAPNPPSINHALAGAIVIVNLSASDETVGKVEYRNQLITGQSSRLLCGYIYANAGEGESTTDLVFGGHNIIAENGVALAESERFKHGIIYGDIDVKRLQTERRRMTTFQTEGSADYRKIPFHVNQEETKLDRIFAKTPFVPSDNKDRAKRCEEILSIQAMGLKKRLEHTNCKKVVIGISGGLDSTLAMLVIVRAFDLLAIPREDIIAVTMPCFGTTDRTYQNACKLTKILGATLREINIKEAVMVHFKDIGHDIDNHDITYENAQARERTQVLMDIANQVGGMVIGTGDMSELALGWATYNGDHMSMYGVNSSVPKTLVRHLVFYYAKRCHDEELEKILKDIYNTPVSPELLPPKDGEITQKTEDVVGPYELHDFYLYYILRFGYEPKKVYRIAKETFRDFYEEDIILKWLKVFYRRFFSQQFKRSCLPDGPKVGSVAVSPRGDLRMPSDASVSIWLKELEDIR